MFVFTVIHNQQSLFVGVAVCKVSVNTELLNIEPLPLGKIKYLYLNLYLHTHIFHIDYNLKS